jgi:uncharacterized cupredoxin-like copper-binding protein
MRRAATKKAADVRRQTWRRVFHGLLVPCLFAGTMAARAQAGPAGEPGEKKEGTVEVRLSEYSIAMPKTLPAGPTTFVLHNEGHKNHSFRIEGPGFSEMVAAPVPPQATGQLQVTLKPGKYKVYCPIGSHEIKGMTLALEVTPKAAAGG